MMVPHDLSAMYSAKAIEYLIAVAFLLSFIPFWRFVHGSPAAARVAVPKPARPKRLVGRFAVPEDVYYHPGHAWARVEPDGSVRIGMDDFARKLVGPLARVRLPSPGTPVEQSEPAWAVVAEGRAVDMLSPVDGVVVETNAEAFAADRQPDPYGRDWLLRVKPARLANNLKGLIVNGTGHRWMELNSDTLFMRLSPAIGVVAQDGGEPVDGLARAIDPEKWDQIARQYFLTDDAAE
jgi:glycine cleavage system H lipoate-binding protein